MLSLEHGAEVPLRRPDAGVGAGEKNYPDTPTALVWVGWKIEAPRAVTGDYGGVEYVQDGILYAPRPSHPRYSGVDVLDGDKITLPEGDFIVRGRPENDTVNVLDGHDFGVRRHRIESG